MNNFRGKQVWEAEFSILISIFPFSIRLPISMKAQNSKGSTKSNNEKRIVHYAFSYQMLPMLIFSEYSEAIWDQLRDSEMRTKTLEEAWMRTCRHFEVEDFEPTGLSGDFITVGDKEFLIVTLPEPVKPPEAWHCIVVKSLTVNKYRYFSSEYSDAPGGGTRAVLGEWVAPMNRRNLGLLPGHDADSCLAAIAGLN